MDLTVLIARKDRGKNLSYCLASIAACKPVPPVLVVDFGSAKALCFPQYPWLSIIRGKRKTDFFHKARALNIGIRKIKTKYLCIVDADQIFSPNFFSVVYRRLVKTPKVFVMCRTYFLRKIPNEITPNNLRRNYEHLLHLAKTSGLKYHGDGCCNGVRTDWAKSVRGYDESYYGYGGEDSDFALRAKLAGFHHMGIEKYVSMVHLPHAKKGMYYNKDIFMKNKKRYRNKVKTEEIIANVEENWGNL